MDQPTQPTATAVQRTDPSTDPLLGLVLDGFDATCTTAGLTLTVGSLIICGNTAPETDYFAWLANEVRTGQAVVAEQAATQFADDPRIDAGLAVIANTSERFVAAVERSGQRAAANRKRRTGAKPDDADDAAPRPRRYLYLADVVLWTPGGGLAHLAYWRAPLSAVTGWSLRRIDPAPMDGPAPETVSPASAAGAGQVDGLAILTQLARGFIDGFRTERDRLQREGPGADDEVRRMAQRGANFVDEFAKEWNRKMEQE